MSSFGNLKRPADGKHYTCTECYRTQSLAIVQKYKDKYNEKLNNSYKSELLKKKVANRSYYQKNKERLKAKDKEFREANPELMGVRKRSSRKKNSENASAGEQILYRN